MDELLALAQSVVQAKQSGAAVQGHLDEGLALILSIKLQHRALVAETEGERANSARQMSQVHSEHLDVLRAELSHYCNEEQMMR